MRLYHDDQRLTAEDSRDFKEALCDAYRRQDLANMLLEYLGWRLEDISDTGTRETIFLEVIQHAEDRSQTREFFAAAIQKRPDNKKLLNLAAKFGLSAPWEQYLFSSQTPLTSETSSPSLQTEHLSPEQRLERKIHELDSDLDVTQWRKKLERLEKQICRIEIQKSREIIYGTGFLVGPNMVMTNYHVVKEVIDGDIPAHKVKLYFDYRLDEHGKLQNPDAPVELADEHWYEDHTEHSSLDLQIHKEIVDVEGHRLDYALLKLKSNPGTTPMNSEQGTMRGWIEVPAADYEFQIEQPLFILHHPNGDPLKLALNTQGIKAVSTRKTRIWYTTSTDYGSSGAPCFDANWQLVAIHQSGDPDYQKDADYNQGIPVATIYDFLKKRGKECLLRQIPIEPVLQQNDLSSAMIAEADTGISESGLPEEARDKLSLTLVMLPVHPSATRQPTMAQLVELNESEIKEASRNLCAIELLQLGELCLQKARERITTARKPFDGNGDLKPIHYNTAKDAFTFAEGYLCKFRILMHAYNSLPDTPSADDHMTIGATKSINLIQKISDTLEKSKKPPSPEKRLHLRNEFKELAEDLEKITPVTNIG